MSGASSEGIERSQEKPFSEFNSPAPMRAKWALPKGGGPSEAHISPHGNSAQLTRQAIESAVTYSRAQKCPLPYPRPASFSCLPFCRRFEGARAHTQPPEKVYRSTSESDSPVQGVPDPVRMLLWLWSRFQPSSVKGNFSVAAQVLKPVSPPPSGLQLGSLRCPCLPAPLASVCLQRTHTQRPSYE